MPHLWVKNDEDRWAVLPLEADGFELSTNRPRPLPKLPANDSALKAVLLRHTRDEETSWVLIAGREREVRLNGVHLALGVQCVADRDEITVPGAGTFYFSTESLARVESFPDANQALYCPRCKQSLEPGKSGVNCPQCRTWYHQTEDLPCWSYAETCALCPQVTDLNAGFRWTPEEL